MVAVGKPGKYSPDITNISNFHCNMEVHNVANSTFILINTLTQLTLFDNSRYFYSGRKNCPDLYLTKELGNGCFKHGCSSGVVHLPE